MDTPHCVALFQQHYKGVHQPTWSLYQSLLLLSSLRVFFVRSEEVLPCPCCLGILRVIGSRRRKCVRNSGESIQLIIRRMRCCGCRRIHHELPNLLVPFKHHEAASIEQVITHPSSNHVPADESTLRRWKSWFAWWMEYAAGCLAAIASRHNIPVKSPSRSLQSSLGAVGHWVGNAVGWLSRAVRPITNSNLWIHTQLAFLS